jgi:hypothetical protein
VSSEAIKGIFGARGDPPAAAVQPAPSIFVATPCYGGQTTCSYTLACIQLQSLADQFGVAVSFSYLMNESLIHRARNELVAKFLATTCTHLFFIDADVGFEAQEVFRLVAAGKDVIAGTYPRKKIYWNNVRMALQVDPDAPDEVLEHAATRFSFKPVGGFPSEITGAPFECEHVTTGFMCIRREVIEKLIRGSEYLEYNVPDAKTDVRLVRYKIFDTAISTSTNELLGEDYWFCERAREAGFKVWL